MKTYVPYFTSFLLLIACAQNSSTESKASPKVVFNQSIVDQLAAMVVVDQTAAGAPLERFNGWTPEWEAYKDSVFRTHKDQLEKIYETYGYPGFDLVGEKGSDHFWLMVQHCDFDPTFQQKILNAMKPHLKKNNANKTNYAYLVDRVNSNTGKKIVYGTQVQYHPETHQAMSLPLEDSLNVNKRRAEMGLESLEEYLNNVSISHFEMNKKYLMGKGITEPKLYPLP